LHRDKLIEYIYIYKAIYATINIYTQGQKCVYYAIYAKHSTLLITCIMYMTFMYINGSETHTHKQTNIRSWLRLSIKDIGGRI